MDIKQIYLILKNNFDNNSLEHSEFVDFMENVKDPYLVLICCILSLRTNDKITIKATKKMLELGSTPQDFAQVELETLSKAIYPVGFYKNKASQIIELSKIILDEYKGLVPQSIEELTKFKGVGRKTANLVLTKGFNMPGICVDVHVHRICNRLGYVKTKTPDETEFELRKKLPQEFWIDFNTYLVTLGQNVCKPTSPKCNLCPITQLCPYQKQHQDC